MLNCRILLVVAAFVAEGAWSQGIPSLIGDPMMDPGFVSLQDLLFPSGSPNSAGPMMGPGPWGPSQPGPSNAKSMQDQQAAEMMAALMLMRKRGSGGGGEGGGEGGGAGGEGGAGGGEGGEGGGANSGAGLPINMQRFTQIPFNMLPGPWNPGTPPPMNTGRPPMMTSRPPMPSMMSTNQPMGTTRLPPNAGLFSELMAQFMKGGSGNRGSGGEGGAGGEGGGAGGARGGEEGGVGGEGGAGGEGGGQTASTKPPMFPFGQLFGQGAGMPRPMQRPYRPQPPVSQQRPLQPQISQPRPGQSTHGEITLNAQISLTGRIPIQITPRGELLIQGQNIAQGTVTLEGGPGPNNQTGTMAVTGAPEITTKLNLSPPTPRPSFNP